MQIRILAAALAACVALPAIVSGQQLDSVRTGAHIRILAPATGVTTVRAGTLVASDSASIGLQEKGITWTIPKPLIQAAELEVGKHSRRTNLINGALIGGLGGVLLGSMIEKYSGPQHHSQVYLGGGIAIGEALGLILGSTAPRESWRTLQLH